MSKKILITGAEGFIGLNLCNSLVQNGFDVVACFHSSDKNFKLINNSDKLKKIKLNILDNKNIENVFSSEKPEIVIHLAAQSIVSKSQNSIIPTLKTNVEGTWNLLEASKKYGSELFIFASTGKTYGEHLSGVVSEESCLNGLTPYAASKVMADKLVRMYSSTYGLKSIIFRLANLYGLFDLNSTRLIPNVCLKVMNDEIPVLNNGGMAERDFLFVEDFVKAVILALKKYDSFSVNEVFNISSAKQKTVKEITNEIISALDKNIVPKSNESNIKEEIEPVFSNEKARKILGWQPETSLKIGIKNTVDWFYKNKDLF